MVLPRVWLIGVVVFVAQVCMWAYTGPINALTVNSVAPEMRVRAYAFQIFLSHAFGDAISPTIIGVLSDWTDSIRTAMLIVPVAFTSAMIIWVTGWRRLADEDGFDGFDWKKKEQEERENKGGIMGKNKHKQNGLLDAQLTQPLMDSDLDMPPSDSMDSLHPANNPLDNDIRMHRFSSAHKMQQEVI
jgi:hypothetical protein